MRIGRGIVLVVLLCIWGCAYATSAAAAGSAAHMYEPNTISVVRLTLPQASIDALEVEPDEYVEGTFSLAETNGAPTGVGTFSTPITVGIRLKGQAGSGRTLDQKAAFKIKFNWVKGQKFLGLKKMTLNNMVQDQSLIHEALAYKLFRAGGVPASRTGYAYVYVNGVDYGMHLNIETLDDVALEQRFGPFKHLYEAGYDTDVETGPADKPEEVRAAAQAYEVDEGSESDISDLETLIRTVNTPSPGDWSAHVEPVTDLKEMTRMWAVEKYIGHWDGYAGMEGEHWPTNYYLFSDQAARFQMLPWGTDQTWSSGLPFDGDAGTLFDHCLADSSCAEMYRRSLRDTQKAVAGADLPALASELATLLKPWEELEVGNGAHHEFTLAQIDSGVGSVGDFLDARPADLAEFLADGPPEIPASAIAVSTGSGYLHADGSSTATVTARVTDPDGNPIPGDQVVFSSSDSGQSLGTVKDHDDGTYTVLVRASNALGPATITATDLSVGPNLKGAATLTQVSPPAALAIALLPASILADGAATTQVTASVTASSGAPVPGDIVVFSSTDPGQAIGPVVDHGDGTYSATVIASHRVGVATITATDASVSPALAAAAPLAQTAPPPPLVAESLVDDRGASTPLGIGRVRYRGGALFVDVWAPGAGTVSVEGSFGRTGGISRACKGSAPAAAAGRVLVECGLSAAFLRRLQRRWLRVRIVAMFARGGDAESTGRTIRLPRG